MIDGVRIGNSACIQDGFLCLSSDYPAVFINEAPELTERYNYWLTLLDIHSDNDTTPQKLIELSKPVLGEPLFLVAPSMKRIAATEYIRSGLR